MKKMLMITAASIAMGLTSNMALANPPSGAKQCAEGDKGQTCSNACGSQRTQVTFYYGTGNQWAETTKRKGNFKVSETLSVKCQLSTFGRDPAPNQPKVCYSYCT